LARCFVIIDTVKKQLYSLADNQESKFNLLKINLKALCIYGMSKIFYRVTMKNAIFEILVFEAVES